MFFAPGCGTDRFGVLRAIKLAGYRSFKSAEHCGSTIETLCCDGIARWVPFRLCEEVWSEAFTLHGCARRERAGWNDSIFPNDYLSESLHAGHRTLPWASWDCR